MTTPSQTIGNVFDPSTGRVTPLAANDPRLTAKMPVRFEKGRNRGTATCADCGRRTWESNIDRSTGLCTSRPTASQVLPQVSCYDKAGEENSHSDGHHDETPSPWCPECQPAPKETPVTILNDRQIETLVAETAAAPSAPATRAETLSRSAMKATAQELLMDGVGNVLGYWQEQHPELRNSPQAVAFKEILHREANRIALLMNFEEAWTN